MLARPERRLPSSHNRIRPTLERTYSLCRFDYAHANSLRLINILKGANQPVPDELFKFGTTVKKKAHDKAAEMVVGQPYSRPVGVEHDVINDGPGEVAFLEVEMKALAG